MITILVVNDKTVYSSDTVSSFLNYLKRYLPLFIADRSIRGECIDSVHNLLSWSDYNNDTLVQIVRLMDSVGNQFSFKIYIRR